MAKVLSFIKEHVGMLCIVAFFFSAGLLRLNDISLYTPDSTLYVIWGNSLAHGNGFVDDTKPDPDRYIINAPLYALIIAPVEIFFPFSLIAVKVYTLMWGCGALILFYFLMFRLLGRNAALGGVILLAFNPMTIVFFTEALSEAPFLVLFLSILLLMEKISSHGAGPSTGETITRGQLTLFFLFLAVITLLREIGIAIVAASILFLLVKKKPKYALLGLCLAIVCFAGWYVRNNIIVGVPPGGRGGNLKLITQHFVTDSSASLTREFFLRAIGNFKTYFFQLGGTLFYSLFSNKQMNLIVNPSGLHLALFEIFAKARYGIIVVASLMMIPGIFDDFRKTSTALFRFLVVLGLLAVIMIYPIYDIRFLTPMLVFMIYYAVRGLSWLIGIAGKGVNRDFVIVPLAIVLMLPNASAIAEILHTNLQFMRDPAGLAKSSDSLPVVYIWPWSEMGGWIREHTEENAIIACPIKELARAVGKRKVLELEPNIAEPVFEASLREFQATYILTAVRWGNFSTYEFQMQESERYRFTPVFNASGLTLYKITSRLREDVPPGQPYTLPTDTVSTTGLLRLARGHFRNSEYQVAASMLQRAHDLSPEMEEPLYQLVVTYVMMHDSANAGMYYRQLLALPQTLSHSLLASQLFHALELENEARTSKFEQHASLATLDASLAYWNNGYYRSARDLMNAVLVPNNDFFVGLLWGFHYNMQMGDTLRAQGYLDRLQKIDSTNIIVKTFRTVVSIGDSIKLTSDSVERSRMHLEIGMLYRKIDLPIVDFDEAERSMKDSPKNVQAYLFMGKTLEDIGRLNSAGILYNRALALEPGNPEILAKLQLIQSGKPSGTGKPQ
jgi:tetratricopeptide (TPR) repeat protein